MSNTSKPPVLKWSPFGKNLIDQNASSIRLWRMYQPIDYYLHLFQSLNGVLFPGGDFSEEYLYVAKLFYVWSLKVRSESGSYSSYDVRHSIAQEFDETKKVFPIWGTCLGFEVLFMLTKGATDCLEQCKGYNFATEVTFTPGKTCSLDSKDNRSSPRFQTRPTVVFLDLRSRKILAMRCRTNPPRRTITTSAWDLR